MRPEQLEVPLQPWAASETLPQQPFMWRHWLYMREPSS